MTLSEEIQTILKQESQKGKITIRDFMKHFGRRSNAFLMVLLTLPIALPFTPPGLNTPFAAVCILLSVNLIFNAQEPKLPAKLMDWVIPFRPDGKFFESMTKMLRWIEALVKPRLGWVVESRLSMPLLGLGALLSSIVMLLPLPVVNSLSSLIVVLIGMGIITKDGLLALASTLAGLLLFLAATGVTIYALYFGLSFVR
jgi:hypothetical protein